MFVRAPLYANVFKRTFLSSDWLAGVGWGCTKHWWVKETTDRLNDRRWRLRKLSGVSCDKNCRVKWFVFGQRPPRPQRARHGNALAGQSVVQREIVELAVTSTLLLWCGSSVLAPEVSDLITVRLDYQDDGRLLFAVGRLNGWWDVRGALIRYFTGFVVTFNEGGLAWSG